jgi:hypothetical protein
VRGRLESFIGEKGERIEEKLLSAYPTHLCKPRLFSRDPGGLKRIDRRVNEVHDTHMVAAGSPKMGESRERKGAFDITSEGFYLTVKRPEPLRSLLLVLDDLERFSERLGEDRSSDLGAGGGQGAMSAARGSQASQSPRRHAVANLPSLPVMRRELTLHLKREVQHLERQARHLARRVTTGTAFLLNELYAKIRKIQSLIADLTHAAAEIVERLYIRLFIDHQQLM